MSTSSKPKSGAPAHPNRFAFRHNKNSSLSKKIASSVSTGGLCSRCAEKIEWRKSFRKYKPLSAPRKCNACHAKTIKAAYHTLCNPCARTRRVCSGCGKSASVKETSTEKEIAEERQAVDGIVKLLPERQRRTVERRVARGEDALQVIDEYVDREEDKGSDSENSSST